MQSKHDLGLPPPAAQPLALSLEQIYNVETCNEESRPLLYTFAGAIYNRGDVRPKLKRLHNGKDVLVVRHTKMVNMTYSEFMTKSKFAGTPKGDNLVFLSLYRSNVGGSHSGGACRQLGLALFKQAD